MLKKLSIITTLLFTAPSFAEQCLTPKEIKENITNNWAFLNINNGYPASAEMIQTFKANLQNFTLAEWMSDAPEGESQCYYTTTQHDAADVYLAKQHLKPAGHHWQEIQKGIYQCRTQCDFS